MRQNSDRDIQKKLNITLAQIRETHADKLAMPLDSNEFIISNKQSRANAVSTRSSTRSRQNQQHLTQSGTFESSIIPLQSQSITAAAPEKELLFAQDSSGNMKLYNLEVVTTHHKDHGILHLRTLKRIATDTANNILSCLPSGAKDYLSPVPVPAASSSLVHHQQQLLQQHHHHIETKSSNYLGWQNVNINLQFHDLLGIGYLTNAVHGIFSLHAKILSQLPYWLFVLAVMIEFSFAGLALWQLVRIMNLVELTGHLTHEISRDSWYFTKSSVQGIHSGLKYLSGFFYSESQ